MDFSAIKTSETQNNVEAKMAAQNFSFNHAFWAVIEKIPTKISSRNVRKVTLYDFTIQDETHFLSKKTEIICFQLTY